MDNTKIDWATATLNPLGQWCYGPDGTQDKPNRCSYCYAVIMAKRGMQGCPQCKAFEKHHHLERLEQLKHWKKPRNIFMQSMGDLFHSEVPDEWIRSVFEACEKAPHHNYLFLTKNPNRYNDLANSEIIPFKQFADNIWLGSTATTESDWFWMSNCHNTFVSIEPILGSFERNERPMKKADWVIIGAESGNLKGKVAPERLWIDNILANCRENNVPVFMKSSLADIWGEPLIQEYPQELLANAHSG